METPSRHSFDLDGSLRVFPIPSPIKGDNYCRLEVDGVFITDRAKYDIVNNSIVFLSVADVPNGSQLDVLVVQSEEALGELSITTNIDTVAQNINSINTVGVDIADVNTLAAITTDIQLLADIQDGTVDTAAITNVNAIRANVTTVAGISGNVTTVANNNANVSTVAGINANVTTVAGIAPNVTTVAGISANVTAVAGNATNINAVAADAVDIGAVSTNIANVNTVAGISGNVTTVAGNTTNVNTVAGISGNVTTVAGISANVTTVSGNTTNINTVAGMSPNVTTVAGISGNVTTVATNNANVTSVATNIADVSTVAAEIVNNNLQTIAADIASVISVAADLNEATSEIDTVATNITNVNTVGNNIANVNTVASNLVNVNNFADTYFIGAVAPVAPTIGDLWFDSAINTMKVYGATGWQNAGSSVNGTSQREVYIATAAQTSFAAEYDVGFVDVFLNGSKLAPADFTATDGSSIVLAVGATVNDIVDIVAYGTFVLADHYSKVAADALFYNKTAADIRFTGRTSSTGSAVIPSGNTGQQDAVPLAGYLRFNTTDASFEGHNGTEWGSIGGGAVNGIFYENDQTIADSYTIVATKNAMSTGPLTLNSGVTVTVESGGRWVVL